MILIIAEKVGWEISTLNLLGSTCQSSANKVGPHCKGAFIRVQALHTQSYNNMHS